MRNSIGGAWLLGIVMTFMMLMVAFISISINYSNAFNIKGEIVNTIEEYQGINNASVKKINSILRSHSYSSMSACRSNSATDKVLGITLNDEPTMNPATKQQLCVKRELSEGKYYYEIEVFFGFSLPLFGDLFTFRIKDKTNVVKYPNDKYFT